MRRWLSLILLLTALAPGAAGEAEAAGKLRVAVHEYADDSDGNAGTTGAAKLLESAGAEVKSLDRRPARAESA